MANPADQLLLLNQRLPSLRTPRKIITLLILNAGHATDKEHSLLVAIHNLDEAKHKDIRIAADNALDGKIAKLALRMRGNLVMFRFDEMVDHVGG